MPPSGLPLPPGASVEVACTFAYTDQTALALAGPAAAGLVADEAIAEVHVGAAPVVDKPALDNILVRSSWGHREINYDAGRACFSCALCLLLHHAQPSVA